MTKKHFEAIAHGINAQVRVTYKNPADQQIRLQALKDVAAQLAAEFTSLNPRFDEDRFLRACGL